LFKKIKVLKIERTKWSFIFAPIAIAFCIFSTLISDTSVMGLSFIIISSVATFTIAISASVIFTLRNVTCDVDGRIVKVEVETPITEKKLLDAINLKFKSQSPMHRVFVVGDEIIYRE
jgi:hypothetical protein